LRIILGSVPLALNLPTNNIMWTCPVCERNFKNNNQSHMCARVDIDDLFDGKPDDLLLAFDKILISVIDWSPCSVGATKKAIVFAKEKAWMVVRPMTKMLDITLISSKKLESNLIKKIQVYGKSFRHQVRISNDAEVTEQLLQLMKEGHQNN